MSLNGYAWVEGNAVNRTDPSGWNPIAPPVPMPYDQLVRWLAGGAAAAAALCTGPQAAACAALAGAALLAAGSATVLYAALVNSNWDAYRAYERVIAEANAGLHPYPPEITATPGAPAQPGYYPGERLNEDPFAGPAIYVRPDPQPAPNPPPTPTPSTLTDPFFLPYDTCTPTPRPKRCDPVRVDEWKSRFRQIAVDPQRAPAYAYQFRVAGPVEYMVDYNGVRARADGIRSSDCSLLDAKHVLNARRSAYVPGTMPDRESYVNGVRTQTLELISRYAALIIDPTSPVTQLELITNRQEALPYLQQLMGATPGRVSLIP
jgi:hypothetical protein